MDSSDFYRVMSLFQEACGLDGEERSAFLDRACAGDARLRGEVEAMLEADARPFQAVDMAGGGAHLLAAHLARAESASGDSSGTAPAPDAMPMASDLFAGQYRIIRPLGEGGMGTVYEAEQTRPRRIVALKLIRHGIHSSGALRRFEHEAHILGRLHHPGIAHIFEAGFNEGPHGRQAYIAMEYVPGKPLTEYCRENELSPSQRLELMVKVCDALQHAHQRGVIHRDLKPGNILVVDEGSDGPKGPGFRGNRASGQTPLPDSTASRSLGPAPKILDFGVARMQDDEQPMTTMHTISGQIVGTLAYMSPEQVAGDPDEIDVRSDIYSIGVILYQLLSGKMPYDLRAKSIPEAAVMIRDQEAPTLSSFNTRYRGDIETIVAKALSKDRDRRYQSAAELAEDIRRHLAGEPIGAKRDSALYVLKKQLRRYRMYVGAAATIAVLIVGSVVWLSVLYERQGQLLDDVEVQRDKAIEASKLAGQRLAETNRLREREQAEHDRAERAAVRATTVNQFLQQMLASADPMLARGPELTVRELLDDSARRMDAGAFSEQPEIEAETRGTIGEAYRRLGNYAEAEKHIRRSLELNRQISSSNSAYVAECISQLAELERLSGRLSDAERDSTEAISMFRRTEQQTRALGMALNVHGMILLSKADYAGAEPLFKESIEIMRSIYGDRHVEVAGIMQNLAALYMQMGRATDAQSMFESSVAIFSETLGPDHPYVALGLNNLGAMAFSRQQFERAEEFLAESSRITDLYYGDESIEAINSLINLATIYNVRGDNRAAEDNFRKALKIQRLKLKPNHPDIAETLGKLGLLLQEEKRFKEAEAAYREAYEIDKAALGPDHPSVALALSNVASILSEQGDDAEAEKLHKEALAIRRAKLPHGHRDTSSSLGMIAGIQIRAKRFAEAEPILRECVEIRRKTLAKHWLCANAITRLGVVLAKLNRPQEAEPLLIEGWTLLEEMPYAPPDYRVETLQALVDFYADLGREDELNQWRALLDEHAPTTQPSNKVKH